MREFKERELEALYKPQEQSSKGDNGIVTIIGGSTLFHGAPLLSLKTASRGVGIVCFTSPEPSVGKVAENLKSKLLSFIWVPWEELGEYIQKSDAVLIGPGLMRYRSEQGRHKQHRVSDEVGEATKKLTERLLQEFPQKQWVIDAGSLQTMEARFIPKNAILTPNQKEFEMLFSTKPNQENTEAVVKEYQAIILLKGQRAIVCSSQESVLIKGGNEGLNKGGMGDVLAGLVLALSAKNPPLLAACAASYLAKKAADNLYKERGFAYNADDLAEEIVRVLGEYFK